MGASNYDASDYNASNYEGINMSASDGQPLVLVAEHSATNLRHLELDLQEEGYRVLTAVNGLEAWDIIKEHKDDISVVVVDRMMPYMDGIELTKRLKADRICRDIPVIMQTAAKKKAEMIEGIEAGVYYYLPKPYDREILLSVVGSACNGFEDLSHLKKDLGQIKDIVHVVEDFNFKLKSLDEAKRLAPMLASIFPNPDQTVLGVSELLINAIEHGNLGVTYAEKTQLLNESRWHEEIKRRMDLEEYRDRYVRVSLNRSARELTLWIRDDGDGFDWREYLEISLERASHNHGRGIAMSKSLSFDTMQYIGRGNEVICKVFL
jgi:CheY-like chemotaxis protein